MPLFESTEVDILQKCSQVLVAVVRSNKPNIA